MTRTSCLAASLAIAATTLTLLGCSGGGSVPTPTPSPIPTPTPDVEVDLHLISGKGGIDSRMTRVDVVRDSRDGSGQPYYTKTVTESGATYALGLYLFQGTGRPYETTGIEIRLRSDAPLQAGKTYQIGETGVIDLTCSYEEPSWPVPWEHAALRIVAISETTLVLDVSGDYAVPSSVKAGRMTGTVTLRTLTKNF